MADPLLFTFPRPLARLILCGGGGLGAIWGPVVRASEGVWTWNPLTQRAIRPATIEQPALLSEPDGWTLPLEHWRTRLAIVAAWLLTHGRFVPPLRCAWLTEIDDDDEMALHWVEGHGEEWVGWHTLTGESDAVGDASGADPHRVRSLPVHLRNYDQLVALLLALYDVPEIRARVEALYA